MKSISRCSAVLGVGVSLMAGMPLLAQTERVRMELLGQCSFAVSAADWNAPAIVILANHAYVAAGQAGLVVVDISDPAVPQKIGSCNIAGAAGAVAVSGRYAYVGDSGLDNGTPGEGLVVIDIADPRNPQRLGACNVGRNVMDVKVTNGHAYLASSLWLPESFNRGCMQVIDISNPASPQMLATYETNGCSPSVAVSGSFAYIPTGGRLYAFDLSNPANPWQAGRCNIGSQDWTDGNAVVVSGKYAYVTEGAWSSDDGSVERRLQVIDVSSPANPQLVAGCDTKWEAHGLALWGSYALVSMVEPWYLPRGGLAVIDISDPTNPYVVGGCDTAGAAKAVSVSGSHAYVVDCKQGLLVYEITELPAITRHSTAGGTLNLQWNAPAKGMKLQRATSLTNPDWQDLLGSEHKNAVSIPIWGGNEFFRMVGALDPQRSVLWGPVTNTANGHKYCLLQPWFSWLEAEAKAQQLGGHLVAINNEAENRWVYETFAMYGGISRELIIGLTDADREGAFAWLTGEPLTYTNWGEREPNDWGGGEDGATILHPGEARASKWNDVWIDCVLPHGGDFVVCGVVEVVP